VVAEVLGREFPCDGGGSKIYPMCSRPFFSGFSGQICPAQAGSESFFSADLDHEDHQTTGTSEFGVMRRGPLKVVESVVESSWAVGCYLN
jgi:hypothetical protein